MGAATRNAHSGFNDLTSIEGETLVLISAAFVLGERDGRPVAWA